MATQRTIPTYPSLPTDPADQSQVAALLTAPSADATNNTNTADIIGNKTDAAVTVVGTTKSIIAYVKGLINKITVPTADATANGFVNDVIGNKTDAAVLAKATNKSIVAYLKGILDDLGTIANTGGTASLGAILGDFANVSLLTKLANIAAQVQQVAPVIEAHASGNLWTIAGGPIYVWGLFGRVTTAIDTAATTKIQFTPTGGSATDLGAACSSLNAKPAETLIGLDGVKATPMVICTDQGIGLKTLVGNMPIMLGTGVISVVYATPPSTGRINWNLLYSPLNPSTTVT